MARGERAGAVTATPIGVVHSPVAETAGMPRGGVEAEVEVFAEFAEGLASIEGNTHLILVAWLHRSGQGQLKWPAQAPPAEVGVFSSRSPRRPNPIGVSAVRLLGREGNRLRVRPVDFVDGTPVLDIKPYSSAWDSVFSARTRRSLSAEVDPPERELPRLLLEGENFHGERCRGVALAARLSYHVRTLWGVAQLDPRLRVSVGGDGCLADALQGVFGATLGSGRLEVGDGEEVSVRLEDRELVARPRAPAGESVQEILSRDIDELFELTERKAGAG
jgi:tRNA-Thr(GGU) m(6)t(6)A37 methyltransferase TsaA